jgi:glucose-1-phosphate adenylyltransferase
MDLVGSTPTLDLASWGVRTTYDWGRIGDTPPARYGAACEVADALVSPGCIVEGKVVESVLSPDVVIEEGAEVRTSVLFNGVVVERGARIEGAIVDKRVRVRAGAQVGGGDEAPPNRDRPELLDCGLTVVGRDTIIPPRTRIGRNCLVDLALGPDDFPAAVEAGRSVRRGHP